MKTKTRFVSLTLVFFILGISLACVIPSFGKPALTPTPDYEQTARASMARLGLPMTVGKRATGMISNSNGILTSRAWYYSFMFTTVNTTSCSPN